MMKFFAIVAVLWGINAKGIQLHLSDEMKSMLSNWDHQKTDISIHGPMTLDVHSSFKMKDGEVFLKSRIYARHRDCADIKKHRPLSRDGVYTIYPDLKINRTVFCDMTTDGGGWTVIQRRQNGNINFYRNWKDYKNGFGHADDEYWLGNDAIHALTKDGKQMLRIDLQRFSREKAHCLNRFNSENVFERINGLTYSNGAYFSTMDSDQDTRKGNCAAINKSGWWHKDCMYANLNGLYRKGSNGINKMLTWYHWGNKWESLKSAAMMIRPKSGV